MENKLNAISVKLNSYVLPETKEYKKGNLLMWGKNHEIPQVLIDALGKSVLHNALVIGLAQQLSGNGFKDNNMVVNKDGETLSDILVKVALDLTIFEHYAIMIHWNLTRTKIVELYHVDFSTLCAGLPDKNGKVTFFYQSLNWKKPSVPITPIKAFDPNDRKEANQIFVYKTYKPGATKWYTDPEYFPALGEIEADFDLSRYKINGLKNKFSAGMIVSFNSGTPTEEEKEAIVKDVERNFSGSENNQSFIVDFAKDKDHAATITAVPTTGDVENQYGKMGEDNDAKLIIAHRISNPLLVGIKTRGTGFSSNADEIKTSYELFYNTVLKKKQTTLESKFNYLLSFMGYPNADLKIDKILPFEIQDNTNPNPTA